MVARSVKACYKHQERATNKSLQQASTGASKSLLCTVDNIVNVIDVVVFAFVIVLIVVISIELSLS